MKNNIRLKTIFLKIVREHHGLSMGVFLVILSSIVVSLIPPLILRGIVNTLANGEGVALGTAICYFILLTVSGGLDAAKEALITIFGQKMIRGLRYEMCKKLTRLPASYYTKHEPGKITSRFVNDVETVEMLFENGIISMIADGCKVIGILVVIFFMSKGLGCIMIGLIPVLFYMTRQFQKRMLSAQIANRVAVGKVNNHVPETIANIRMIHVFAKEAYMEKRYKKYIEESYGAMEKSNFYDAIYSPIILTISAVVVAVMMVLSAMGGQMQSFFGMSVGTAVAVIAYVGKVFDPLESIGMEIENIQSAIAGMKRINRFLEEPERRMPGKHVSNIGECVRFQEVSFGYEEAKMVLRHENLSVETGESVTFAGRTGAGKSTIFKLILGMYPPSDGRITIYGVDAEQIQDKEKRKLFGYVEQSFHEVLGTVGDQITLYDKLITRDQMVAAAKLVGIHDTIMQLDGQYDAYYRESLFSKGEIQLLSIARAVVMNPRVLLLDEITANLDSATEKAVIDAIGKASDNRTVLSISHRLYEQKKEGRVLYIEG